MINLAVFISGRGSNFRAIHENIKSGYLKDVELKLLVSNNPHAEGIKYACEENILVLISGNEDIILKKVKQCNIDLICLAGFDQILSLSFLEKFNEGKWKIMNIHPALLPSFSGNMHAQRDALEYGVKISGCTVHFIDEKVDNGPIISQASVEVLNDDTEVTLSDRILEQEHILYSKAIKLFSENKLKVINGRHVKVD